MLSEAWLPHNLTAEQLEEYEERIAILEADGATPFRADFEARRICKERWRALVLTAPPGSG
jgi:hypothetical protein